MKSIKHYKSISLINLILRDFKLLFIYNSLIRCSRSSIITTSTLI